VRKLWSGERRGRGARVEKRVTKTGSKRWESSPLQSELTH